MGEGTRSVNPAARSVGARKPSLHKGVTASVAERGLGPLEAQLRAEGLPPAAREAPRGDDRLHLAQRSIQDRRLI